MKITKVLIPVDFSKHSIEALEYGLDFAAPFGAEIHLLHVVEPVAYASPADIYAGMATQLGSLLAEQRAHARKQLDALAEKYATPGRQVRAHLRDGIAYREIVDGGKQLGADMIIQATHGRTGLAHVLMGSVAERVIRTADCPVLTIRTRGVVGRATKAGKASKTGKAGKTGKTAAKQIAQPTATKKAKKKPPTATKKATQVAAKRPSTKKGPK